MCANNKTLYLGTDPKHYPGAFHFPVIRIVARKASDPHIIKVRQELDRFSHLVFTSKHAVFQFFTLFNGLSICTKTIFSVGKVTTEALRLHAPLDAITAKRECQEGVIELLEKENLEGARFLLVASELARPLLRTYLTQRGVEWTFCPLYTTVAHADGSLPHLEEFEAIVFTSPSVVEAFFSFFGTLPKHLKVITQGAVTKKRLISTLKFLNA